MVKVKKSNTDDGKAVPIRENKLRRLELLAISIAAIALSFDVAWNMFVERPRVEEDRRQAEETRAFQVWTLLANRSAGPGGKVSALEYLSRRGPIIGVDLSCTDTKSINYETEVCQKPVILRELGVSDTIDHFDLRNSNLSGAWVVGWRLTDSYYEDVDMRGVKIVDSVIQQSTIIDSKLSRSDLSEIDLTGTTFKNTDLYATTFWKANLTNTDFSRTELTDYTYFTWANLSSTNFGDLSFVNAPKAFGPQTAIYSGSSIYVNGRSSQADNLRKDLFYYSWAWSDMPPSIPKGYEAPVLCKPDQTHLEQRGRAIITKECDQRLFERCKTQNGVLKQVCTNTLEASAPVRE